MSPLPTVGRIAPQSAVARLSQAQRRTERAVREGLANVGNLTGATIFGGLLRIFGGGGVVVEGNEVDPASGIPLGDTIEVLRIGALPDDPRFNHADGTRQMGVLMRLDDGTLALSLAEMRADDGQYAQTLTLWDKAGTPGGIVAADGNSGRGLARPHLGQFAGNGDTNVTRWPSTTNTDWTAVWSQYWEIQNPKLSWNAQLLVPANCVGQFRLKYGDTVIGTSAQVNGLTTGTFSQWFGGRVELPGAIGDELTLTVEAMVVAGSGEIRHNWVQLKGDQS